MPQTLAQLFGPRRSNKMA